MYKYPKYYSFFWSPGWGYVFGHSNGGDGDGDYYSDGEEGGNGDGFASTFINPREFGRKNNNYPDILLTKG